MPATDREALDERVNEYRALAVERRQRRFRSNVAACALALDVAALCVNAGQLHGPFRQLVGLAFCLTVPGWAIVGLLRLHDAALEFGLTVAASLATLVVVAQLAISFGAWGLTAIDVTVAGLCLPSLAWQTMERRRLRAAP